MCPGSWKRGNKYSSMLSRGTYYIYRSNSFDSGKISVSTKVLKIMSADQSNLK